jgi:hypothetical protein
VGALTAPLLEVMAGAPLEVNLRGSGDRARLVAPGSLVFWLGSEVITSLLVLVVEPRWQGKRSAMAEVVCAAEVAGLFGATNDAGTEVGDP